jgi:hypothetical protein
MACRRIGFAGAVWRGRFNWFGRFSVSLYWKMRWWVSVMAANVGLETLRAAKLSSS